MTERLLTLQRRFYSVVFVVSLNKIEVRSEHQRSGMTRCTCVRVYMQDVKEW